MRLIPLLLALAIGAPQVTPLPPRPATPAQPVRDPGRRPPPEPTGTGIIRGRVVGADTGNPVRRATVNLSMMPPSMPPGGIPGGGRGTPPSGTPISGVTFTTSQTMTVNGVTTTTTSFSMRPKTATTDAQGAFEFRGLPAGSYRLSANPGQYSAAYLGINYGAKRPNGPMATDPGTPIQLADGQTFDKATIVMPRGAVITGRVTDEDGAPLARVQVYTVFFPPGSTRGQRTGAGGNTDDLGQFRLFGLTPGEYSVVAEARGNTFVQPNAPPEPEEDKVGFMTTYYPGTADEAAAQRVTARTGLETPGIEIRVVSGRLFRVSGMIVDSQGRAITRTGGSLQKRSSAGGMSSFGFSLDDQGHFAMKNVPPGDYRLTVRQQIPRPNGMNEGPPEVGEFASMPLSINSDLENILVTTSPGATITGTVMFESGPPQTTPGATPGAMPVRINAVVADPQNGGMVPTPQPATVLQDYTFTMKGMMGEYLLRGTTPMQTLKAVTMGAEDITDTPREFKNGDRVTLVFTSHTSSLEGTVTDAKGTPVPETRVMVFSEDKASWRSSSTRTRNGNSDANGLYRIMGLLPGRYYIIAAPRDRFNTMSPPDASFFEALAKEATTFVVGEDEKRTVDLKVVGGGG